MDRILFVDFALTLIFLPICMFLMLPVFFTILVFQGRPVFFVSPRVGANASTFQLIKFRTMTKSAPLIESSLQNESLITPIGRHLRRLSIDELPQILNVAFGHMRLVGPRPCLESQYDLIQEREAFLHPAVKPGITGLAQVRGRDFLTTKQKARYERFYENNKSLRLYFFVLCHTFKSVVLREGR